jgi:hypothetical protein
MMSSNTWARRPAAWCDESGKTNTAKVGPDLAGAAGGTVALTSGAANAGETPIETAIKAATALAHARATWAAKANAWKRPRIIAPAIAQRLGQTHGCFTGLNCGAARVRGGFWL